uniref:Sm protein E n=1 Tax=Aegilops tauschii subsp. strangulata TaxID=200361 RepID=A0A453RYT5_AEGTS
VHQGSAYHDPAHRTLLYPLLCIWRIQIWLFEQKDMRIEGRIIVTNLDMNLVLEDAEEINIKKNTRKSLG